MASDRTADLAGIHACQAALEAGRVERLCLPRGRLNKRQEFLLKLAREKGVPVTRVDATGFSVSAPVGVKHQGALAWFTVAQASQPAADRHLDAVLAQLSDQALLLVLDGVEDPRNLGACLRSADGAGVDAVIVPRSRGAPVTAVTRKTAAGAAESLRVIEVANLAQALRLLQQHDVQIVGLADTASSSLYDSTYAPRCALVLGNEGQGLRQLTQKHCDLLVSLPMYGAVSSLNVSVATGVALFELRRQRRDLAS